MKTQEDKNSYHKFVEDMKILVKRDVEKVTTVLTDIPMSVIVLVERGGEYLYSKPKVLPTNPALFTIEFIELLTGIDNSDCKRIGYGMLAFNPNTSILTLQFGFGMKGDETEQSNFKYKIESDSTVGVGGEVTCVNKLVEIPT